MKPRPPTFWRWAVGSACLLSTSVVAAHQRLYDTALQVYLHWQNPGNISFVVQALGSDDVVDGSHVTALRNAALAWNELDGTTAALVEDTDPLEQARTDWQEHDLHLLAFDETNASGFFPAFSGIVAITPVYYDASGRILDADVLFNGAGFEFTTSGEAGRYDIQSVAAHELGHLLGLDHSGWAGATMYPYVDVERTTQRSLSRDEHNGMRDAYPQPAAGELRGTVRRASGNTVVEGAHVVALDPLGHSAGSDLSDAAGQFRIRGLASDLYQLQAVPLEGAVSAANLSSVSSVEVDFQATSGATFAVSGAQVVATGTLFVDPDAPVQLGQPFDALPARATIGAQTVHALNGSGLVNGSTLVCSDSTVGVTPVLWNGNSVVFGVDVPALTAPGHADLTAIEPGGARSTLVAALEFVRATPGVTAVNPAVGPSQGGTFVTITGSDFAPGLKVVLGEEIYVEGEPGGCLWVDAATLSLTTRPQAPATHDLVVIDATGVEGRLIDAYRFASAPSIDSVFPPTGFAGGGTRVRVEGADFMPGATVRIAGTPQSNVVVESASALWFESVAGVVGGPYALEVVNPDASTASATFSYAPQVDPQLDAVAPNSGSTAGGKTVLLSGSGFNVASQVWFGADAGSGVGGTQASSVTLQSSTSLQAVTPAHAKGSVVVLVRDAATGQAVALPGAFTFKAPSSGSGGGGCSIAEPGAQGTDGGEALEFLLPLVLALALWLAGTRANAARRQFAGR